MTEATVKPVLWSANGQRAFVCSPVAVQAVLVDPAGRVLLLSSPLRNPDGAWQVVSGALEADESVLEGAWRELHEELGTEVRVRPLGTVHVHTFDYDHAVRFMVGIYYLFAYDGGPLLPGDDMRGSTFRWFSLRELAEDDVKLHVPRGEKWILRRAVELYRLWNEQIDIPL